MRVKKETVLQASKVHEVRNAAAISGAVMGATAGILGGVVGIGAAGVVGAVLGALGGLALEREARRTAERERALELEREARADRADVDVAAGIEPPCPDCLAVCHESAGTVAWCAHHAAHHPHGQLHYAYPPSFGVGSMLLRPAA